MFVKVRYFHFGIGSIFFMLLFSQIHPIPLHAIVTIIAIIVGDMQLYMNKGIEINNLLPLNSYPFTKPYLARVCEGQNRVYKLLFTPLAVKPFYIF